MKIGCATNEASFNTPQPESHLHVIAFVDQKKPVKKRLSFYHCFQPVYITSRIFGVLPFTIYYNSQKDHIEKVGVGFVDGIWFVGAILLNAVLVYLVISTLDKSTEVQSAVLLVGGRMLLIVGLLNSALVIIMDMINRNRLRKILNEFLAYDKEVRPWPPISRRFAIKIKLICFNLPPPQRLSDLEYIVITRRTDVMPLLH